MKRILLLLLLVSSASFSLPISPVKTDSIAIDRPTTFVSDILGRLGLSYNTNIISILTIRDMLAKQSSINSALIAKLLTSLKCSEFYNLKHNQILTIIDYSLPSNEKRLWVFDLAKQQLLFNTYVSHGIMSGDLLTKFFSNKNNSKSSSIGLYTTDKSYYGREGVSLRLAGLERGFNDNAYNRSIVMHGGWYMDEQFIKRYGRAGRSWGCPAVPLTEAKNLINTIKEQSLFFVYYPDDIWFSKSKYLNCENSSLHSPLVVASPPLIKTPPMRDKVLFAHVKTKVKSESAPILVISADNYEKFFKARAPLERMLRRQIENKEYIALSNDEFAKLFSDPAYATLNSESKEAIMFTIPVIKMVRGYYETEMQKVDIGKIKEIKLGENPKSYTILFDNRPALSLQTSDSFIRWLGL